jgi:hypothetical protein
VPALDHRTGPDDDAVLDVQLVVGQQMQHGVLENLDPAATPDRAVRISDDLHARADQRVLADHDVARDLGAVEQHRAGSEDRRLVAIGVESAHVRSCPDCGGQPPARKLGEVRLMHSEHREALAVIVGSGADRVRRTADQHRRRRDHRALGDGAFTENAAVPEPCAGHEDGTVADLAEAPDARADDLRPVTEHGALPDQHRVFAHAHDYAVLADHRVVADRNRILVGAQHRGLRDDRAGAEVQAAQDDGRTRDFGLRRIRPQPIQAHPGSRSASNPNEMPLSRSLRSTEWSCGGGPVH